MEFSHPVTSNPRLNVPMTPEQWDVVDFLAFESETAVYYPFDTAFDDLTMDMIDSIVSQCGGCTDDSNVIFEAATRVLGIPAEEQKKVNWFEEITARLRDYSEGDIWSSGDEILCKTESAADALADLLECLYKADGEEILVNTGYYDPVEDERNGELDRFTGWWYVNIC